MSTPSVGLVDWMQDASGYAEFTFRTIGRASRNHVWRLESRVFWGWLTVLARAPCISMSHGRLILALNRRCEMPLDCQR